MLLRGEFGESGLTELSEAMATVGSIGGWLASRIVRGSSSTRTRQIIPLASPLWHSRSRALRERSQLQPAPAL